MAPNKRFLIGGGGALMPVLVSLLAIDIGAALNDESILTTGNIVGLIIRYIVLFIIGGVVAYMHEDETKPFKLFELGIAAPALITSLITAQGVSGQSPAQLENPSVQGHFSIIGSAYAGESPKHGDIVIAGFFSDVGEAFSGSIYKDINNPVKRVESAVNEPIKPIDKPTEQNTTDIESNKNINIIRAKAEAARAKAAAQAEKANATRLKAEAARAKAEALEKEYEASLAQAKASEAQAIVAEEKVNLLQSQQDALTKP